MTILDPRHETQRQRDARLSREAARRSREWRQRQRMQRAPDSRATHSAVAEAIAFLAYRGASTATARNFLPGADGGIFSLREVVLVATISLRRDGYGLRSSFKRVTAALDPRSDHDSPVRVPSRRPVEGPAIMIPPRLAEKWTDEELRLMRQFMTIGDRTSLGGR